MAAINRVHARACKKGWQVVEPSPTVVAASLAEALQQLWLQTHRLPNLFDAKKWNSHTRWNRQGLER